MAARRTTRRSNSPSVGASSSSTARANQTPPTPPPGKDDMNDVDTDIFSESFTRQMSLVTAPESITRNSSETDSVGGGGGGGHSRGGGGGGSNSSTTSSSQDEMPGALPALLPPAGTHKRELSDHFSRMSSINSVEMMEREGRGGEQGDNITNRRVLPPSTKRSNGGETPMGIRALKDEGSPAVTAPSPAIPSPSSLYTFQGETFAVPPSQFQTQAQAQAQTHTHTLPAGGEPILPSPLTHGLSARMATRTLIIYPPICLQHETDIHQESKERLKVLCGPQGVLRRPQFAALEWADGNSVLPATISDLLRVHDFAYITHLRKMCMTVPGRGGGGGKCGGGTGSAAGAGGHGQAHTHTRRDSDSAPSALLESLPAIYQPNAAPTQPPPELLRPTGDNASTHTHTHTHPSGSGHSSPALSPVGPAEGGGEGGMMRSSGGQQHTHTHTQEQPPTLGATAATAYNHGSIARDHTHTHPPVTRSSSLRDFPMDGKEGDYSDGCVYGDVDENGDAAAAAADDDGTNETANWKLLDIDTRLSRRSFEVACIAAGAVIQAVDQAAAGRRRTFVASRPPGHHAGPRGAVPGPSFYSHPSMCSSGFCLLNNVCIGAAYARQTYGRPPHGQFQRIAIVDFDIHTGQGTQACVEALRPRKRTMPLPASWAPEVYEEYKPWLSEEDAENVFFASINLVDGVHFYPCCGGEEENDFVKEPNIVNVALSPVRPANAAPGTGKPQLRGLTAKKVKENCLKASQEFREKVGRLLLPRLRHFGADLLFISAGFDGHMDDYYHWLTDDDYAWLTRELAAIMEETSGKIISVLEGGYHCHAESPNNKQKGVAAEKPTRGNRGNRGQQQHTGPSDDDESMASAGGSSNVGGGEEELGGLPKGVAAHVLALMEDSKMKLDLGV